MKDTIYNFEVITKKEKHILLKSIINTLRPLKYLHFAKLPISQEELYKAYTHTIKKHSLEKELEGYYLKGAFWELAKFDKINTHKNKPFLVKLDRLFHSLKRHIQIKDTIKNSYPFSTVKTTYSTHPNFIQPTINAYETTLEDDINNISINNKIKLLNEYKNDPLSISVTIQASTNSKYNSLFEDINKKDFQDLNKRIVSHKLKLSKKDISKSLQLYIISLYKNNSIHNQLLKDIPPITNKKLLLYAEQISKKFIDINTESLNVKNINAKVNHIDIFDDIIIMQPTIQAVKKQTKIKSYEELISHPKLIF